MNFVRLMLTLLAGVLTTAPSSSAPPQLNVFIWSEYLDPAVVSDFERQFGCAVVLDLYEDDAAMMAKLRAGGASLYDVVVPPDHRVSTMVKLNLLAPLRHENLPNLKHLDARFRSPPYDRDNRYSVAYQWGTTGLFVRKTPGQPLPDSWGAILAPTPQAEPFVLLDSPRDLIAAALKYRGHSLNSTQPAHLREARDLLLAAKRRCLGFDGSVGGKNKVLGKHARAAVVYSGEAARGMAEDPETAYVIPKEGAQIWLDNLVVLTGAPHRDLAEKFLNFCLDPRVGARLANFTRFATPNLAARAFVRPEDLRNPAIYPPEDLMAKLEFTTDLGSAARLYDEVWTQIKAK
jgi:spermidine/putrescine transport system substrate-binding protein